MRRCENCRRWVEVATLFGLRLRSLCDDCILSRRFRKQHAARI